MRFVQFIYRFFVVFYFFVQIFTAKTLLAPYINIYLICYFSMTTGDYSGGEMASASH